MCALLKNIAVPQPSTQLHALLQCSLPVVCAPQQEVSNKQLDPSANCHLQVHPDLETGLIQVLWGLKLTHFWILFKKNDTKTPFTNFIYH